MRSSQLLWVFRMAYVALPATPAHVRSAFVISGRCFLGGSTTPNSCSCVPVILIFFDRLGFSIQWYANSTMVAYLLGRAVEPSSVPVYRVSPFEAVAAAKRLGLVLEESSVRDSRGGRRNPALAAR